MTYRRAWVLLRGLPRSSRFVQAIDPDGTRWTQSDHLLATVIDTLHGANGSKWRYPRPGSEEEREALERAARRERQYEQFMQRQREQQAAEGRSASD